MTSKIPLKTGRRAEVKTKHPQAARLRRAASDEIETLSGHSSKDDAEADGRLSALARGIGVLRCFTPAQTTLGSKELIERSGLPKPTAFRTIQTLVELGLIQASEERGRYMLAPGVLALAAPLLSSMTIRTLARALMQELADYAQGQVSLVCGTTSQRPLFVEICAAKGNTVFRPELGSNSSLSRTAAGRAYLILLDEASREHHLRELELIDSAREQCLRKKLEDTRRELDEQGYCCNLGELDPITVGVAVPVHVPIDGHYFGFGCTVPSFRLIDSPKLLEDLGMRLATLVQNVEATLGIAVRR